MVFGLVGRLGVADDVPAGDDIDAGIVLVADEAGALDSGVGGDAHNTALVPVHIA